MGESSRYDLIVIGSGPAGEKGAAQTAYFGKRVALIEKEPILGGAAANTGTLPSKTLRETSLYLSGYRQRGLFGVDFVLKREATVRDLLYRERLVAETERQRVRRNLQRHNVVLFQGHASLLDPHTVAVRRGNGAGETLTGDVILVATGSHPNRPRDLQLSHPLVHDSDTILTLEEIPRSLAVVGGGVIGCEYACVFAALGIEVTLIEGREVLLSFLDGEISAILRQRMEALGVRMRVPDAVQTLDARADEVVLTLASGEAITARAVLVAAGRNGNTHGLGLEAVGVKLGPRGHIEVNAQYRTAVSHIYAAGDVIGFPALASTSMEQARIAMVHAFDLKYKKGLAPILPFAIYTIPEISMAGETEESLQKQGIEYVAGRAYYAANSRGQIIGDGGGLLKLLFSRDDLRLLGVHLVGEQASELVHIGLTALLLEATADLFIQTCYNYPTLSETYKYATYDAMGRRGGIR